MAGNQDGLKKTLLGWVQGALHKVEHALDEPEAPVEAPAPKAPTGGLKPPGSGPLPRPGSGPLPAAPPVTRRAPDTGSLNRSTDSLVRASGPLPPPRAAAPVRTPEEEAAESKKRLGFITAYMKNPQGDPAFEDRALVYKILSEERAYQQAQIVQQQQALKQLPPPAEAMGLTPEEAAEDPRYDDLEARRSAIEERLKTAQSRQTQLFMLMKKLTGVKGKTGGTGFLSTPPPAFPPPPPTPSPTPQRDGVEERDV
ncbi:MAG: hypothetical protein ACLGIN_07730 [Candidatus Sericytochromatia bacterium]